MEDLLYEAESVRRFAGLRLPEPIPDESAILHFRHLLERHQRIDQEHGTDGPAAWNNQSDTHRKAAGNLTQGVVRLLDPNHQKSGPGRVEKTSSERKATGAEAPRKAAPVQHILKRQFL